MQQRVQKKEETAAAATEADPKPERAKLVEANGAKVGETRNQQRDAKKD